MVDILGAIKGVTKGPNPIGAVVRAGEFVGGLIAGKPAQEAAQQAYVPPEQEWIPTAPEVAEGGAKAITVVTDAFSNAGKAAIDLASKPFDLLNQAKKYALPLAIAGAGLAVLVLGRK